MRTKMLRASKIAIMLYAPAQNVAFLTTLLCHKGEASFTSFQHLLVVDIDSIALFILARTFGFCRAYQLALLNPVVWNTLLYHTPLSWNVWIEPAAVASTGLMIFLMLQACVKSAYKTYKVEYLWK